MFTPFFKRKWVKFAKRVRRDDTKAIKNVTIIYPTRRTVSFVMSSFELHLQESAVIRNFRICTSSEKDGGQVLRGQHARDQITSAPRHKLISVQVETSH
ncbi:hypothetical protein PsorP6_010938 [Peronosclerospora sorghi]|uniref:Uncharacterized protein n=1 Tax=Peronosclerospora sorghi TaxID=230839 RepID=A0ACC0VYN3_9STRA|nr:hypothetical protein PsorP6_010938 [Peronosclerospora sorghi]